MVYSNHAGHNRKTVGVEATSPTKTKKVHAIKFKSEM